MKKVLIVDDAYVMRKKLRKIVENLNYEVCGEAENGREAFEKYKELSPDLVTLDISMPEVDGMQCLEMIKNYDKNAQVLMVSALEQKELIRSALMLGARSEEHTV